MILNFFYFDHKMKQLTLIRHAIAEDKLTTKHLDINRPLTTKWRKKVLQHFENNISKLNTIDIILCSPSTRTRQTCNLLTSIIDFNTDRIIYDQSLYNLTWGIESLKNLIQSVPEDKNHVCIIGHNDSISALASNLLGHNIHMKKGDIVQIDLL